MTGKWAKAFSVESRGARHQIGIAAALMAALPILVIFYVALLAPSETYSFAVKTVIGGFACLMAAGGYLILTQYPQTVARLRCNLQQIAEGQRPEKITLLDSQEDIRAIENCLNKVLDELQGKVTLLENQLRLTREMQNALESQQQELLEAERHRAMINSLGAACHHIGQPATLLRAHLHFLKNQSSTPKKQVEIEECEKASDSIAEILDKLRGVSEYRTVPYRTFSLGDARGENEEILDIENQEVPIPRNNAEG